MILITQVFQKHNLKIRVRLEINFGGLLKLLLIKEIVSVLSSNLKLT